jgi:NAD(P)-dependent dehydrogenase (short-subunit alcohol dehydrogenase family)
MMGLSDEHAATVKADELAQIPLGRRSVPEDVAAWIVRLTDSAAAWIPGQVLAVDGGLGLV